MFKFYFYCVNYGKLFLCYLLYIHGGGEVWECASNLLNFLKVCFWLGVSSKSTLQIRRCFFSKLSLSHFQWAPACQALFLRYYFTHLCFKALEKRAPYHQIAQMQMLSRDNKHIIKMPHLNNVLTKKVFESSRMLTLKRIKPQKTRTKMRPWSTHCVYTVWY